MKSKIKSKHVRWRRQKTRVKPTPEGDRLTRELEEGIRRQRNEEQNRSYGDDVVGG